MMPQKIMETKNSEFEKYLKKKAVLTERGLERFIAGLRGAPTVLVDAMHYSLAAGGKRLRPALVMASAEAFGFSDKDALPAACAVEMIHTYSLIHDDLPPLDNDNLRRGLPTCHRVYGEAGALLAGDALLTFAFSVCARCADNKKIGPARALAASACLADAAGACGMVGGQMSDIFAEGIVEGASRRAKALSLQNKNMAAKPKEYFLLPGGRGPATRERVLDYIHRNKTGALLAASVEMGALVAGATGARLEAMRGYGREAGLAFQIADDILDVTADRAKLGKSSSDAAAGKLTYVTLYGLEKSRETARNCIARAQRHLEKTRLPAKRLEPLYALARFILERTH
jgi:geranylgeranyl diphosphate synthase type II